MKKITGHNDWVMSVSFSPDGSQIASGSLDKTVRTWNASSGTEMKRMTGHEEQGVGSVSFSHDGKYIVGSTK